MGMKREQLGAASGLLGSAGTLVRLGLGEVAEMTLQEAVSAAIKASRAEMECHPETNSHFIKEIRIPTKEWYAVMRVWREERSKEIAKQGLKELREAIYGESK